MAILLLAAMVGSVDLFIRIEVRSYVKSESASEQLKKKVKQDVDKVVSRGFQEAVDDWNWFQRMFIPILVNVEDKKERYISCGRSFVEEESNRMSVGILSEPVLGMGWCVSCYKFTANWRGHQLATFNMEGELPVNVRIGSCSRFERQLRGECEFDPCG